ncbi:MAG: ATP-binding protein, partial [Bacteroidota bacterium]
DFAANEAFHFGKQSGLLYIGREGKLFQYAPLTKKERWFDFKQIYSRELRVLAIEEDAQRNLWLATDAGLIHFNPQTEEVKQYTKQEGLPHDFVCGMLTEGDSALWLSTNHGLSRFSKASESFINFYKEDGLTDNEFNRKSFFKARDGRMYFGGLKGINAFYPNELLRNFQQQSERAQLSLASFEYTDEKEGKTHRQLNFPAEAGIEIYYHHRSFTFEYALTDYRNASEVAYSYRMKGYENTWSVPSKFNFTRFSSLPEGEYEFEVKAKDSHGIWHPNQLSVKVIVYPPWWASWWAYMMYAILIGGILYTIYTFLSKRWELQQKLREEQEEAIRLKNLDSFKSKLYTNLTHEFRTPLTVILGMADQIKNQPDKYLDKGTHLIKSNGMNLLRLINQLLDLSKLEDKSFQLRLENGDFVSYLRYITESFQTFANTQNISLRFQSREDELLMDFDPEQIKQVMTNLISNAIKFTPSGGGVEVELKRMKDLSSAQIVVKDTGIGIEKKNLPNIFDRFYQVDGSITREGEGSGIGLTHTLELVKLMDGTIEVSSEAGKGTSFIILLPIQDRLEFNPKLIQKDSSSSAGMQKAVHPEVVIDKPILDATSRPSVLIIEDNVDVVDYLKACLEDQFSLSVAFNGRIGIEKALEDIPDLIVSDVMMPEKDGYEVCDSLKNDDRTSHIPIILLTAKADVSSKITGLRRGADAYLAKPFIKEELIVRLEQLMERQRRMIRHFSAQYPSSSELIEHGMQEAIQQEDIFIQKVRSIIEENYADEDFGLPQLCRKIGMSRSQLYRKMKALIDIPPSDFIRNYRLEQAKILLKTSQLSVSEVAWQVGFKDLSHFSKAYQAMFGVLPSATSK